MVKAADSEQSMILLAGGSPQTGRPGGRDRTRRFPRSDRAPPAPQCAPTNECRADAASASRRPGSLLEPLEHRWLKPYADIHTRISAL